MIGDFLYLWKNRERPRNLRRYGVVWAKRVLNVVALVRLLVGPGLLRRKGAKVGRLVVLGKSRIEGRFSNLQIGDETSLGRCHIALHDRVTIGRRVCINDGATLLSATHALSDPQWRHKKRPVRVDDYAWIATGAIILPGVHVGRGAVIGAGAVVRGDVPDYAVVTGNPARATAVVRTSDLRYSPVLFNAPFEAWVGPSQKMVMRDEDMR